jgi:hypothetical protein
MDKRKSESLIDLFLGSAGNSLVAVEESIFVQFQPFLLSNPTERDIMILAPGKIA